jgi:predicted RNA-binding Zn ribbon-like protein
MASDRSGQPPAAGPPLLADHPALDFLNTRPGIHTDSPAEHIGDGDTLLAWLVTAGLLSRAEAAGIRRRFPQAQLDALAQEARTLREQLRTAVAAWQRKGSPPTAAVLADLNRLLAAAPMVEVARAVDGRVRVLKSRRMEGVAAVLTPVAAAFAELFAEADRDLVRECEAEACSLWFYDRTKAHRRRWCSMGACGARAKAAAYRARNRDP